MRRWPARWRPPRRGWTAWPARTRCGGQPARACGQPLEVWPASSFSSPPGAALLRPTEHGSLALPSPLPSPPAGPGGHARQLCRHCAPVRRVPVLDWLPRQDCGAVRGALQPAQDVAGGGSGNRTGGPPKQTPPPPPYGQPSSNRRPFQSVAFQPRWAPDPALVKSCDGHSSRS